MIFKLTPISLAIFIAAFVNIFVAVSSWQRRKSRDGIYFALAMQAITLWTLAAGLDYAAVPAPLKVFFAKLEYLGYTSAISLFAAFSLSYAGYEAALKKAWVKFFLVGLPVSTVLLALTNELHGWVWTGFRVNPDVDNVLIFEHGPAFIWVTLSGYALILVIFFCLVQTSLKGSGLARKQARLLLLAFLALVASNLLYLLDIFHTPGVDWSSVTFSVTGLWFLMALYGSRFMDVVPVARNVLIDQMSEGVLVLDDRGNLVDFNPAAREMLGLREQNLWGSFQIAFAGWPQILELLMNPSRPRAIEIITGDPEKVFDFRLTPLKDNLGNDYGLLVVMRNIAERKKAEEQVRLAQEQLLNQRREQAVVDERQRMARNLHDSVSQSIHSLALFSETLAVAIEKNNRERALQVIGRLQESARQVTKEMRMLLYEYQGAEAGQLSLVERLETRLGMVERRSGMRVTFSHDGSWVDCPVEWRENLYWIVIESLNNIIKHAQAHSVEISLRGCAAQVELEVRDDGLGFDLERVGAGGQGLKNLRARAGQLGGALTIESVPGRGTLVRFYGEHKARFAAGEDKT